MSAAILSAAWLGILCAISPCPLATNIAAMGVLARDVARPFRVAVSGLAYVLGRIAVYAGVMSLIAVGVASAPGLSHALQKYVSMLTGPLLIVVGLVLLGLITPKLPGVKPSANTTARLVKGGIVGAFSMGAFFALAMCPTSAALYFGGLMPLVLDRASPILLPSVFGFATSLPVVAAAILLAYSTHGIGRFFSNLTKVERWFRIATGIGFLAVGAWMAIAEISR